VTQLLKSDTPINPGVLKLKFLLPEITENQLEDKYIQDLDISGSELIIYWDRSGDDQYIYKLNDPQHKSFDERFNEIIVYYIFQDYLFPDCKYDNLKICGDKMFVRQRATESGVPSRRQIESCMANAGYRFSNETLAWMVDIRDISVRVSDLNEKNCKIKGSKLEIFDPRIRIYYEKV
jgi:hypothetical protein